MKEALLQNESVIKPASGVHAEDIVNLLHESWLKVYPSVMYGITSCDLDKKFGDPKKKIVKISKFIDENLANPVITYLIAETNTGLVGFIYANREGDDLYINALYIDSNHQRRGIGSALIESCIQQNIGIESISVDVVAYNEQAIAFYLRNGFHILGDSHTSFGKFPDGKIVPEIRMLKNIGDD